MVNEPLVSVIIPSYQQKHVMFDALASMLRQKATFPYEIILVESSGDDSAEMVRRRYPQIRVIELSERAYPGTARNEGIRQTKGKYIAFTDTDCMAREDWLENLVKSHRRGYRVVGGKVKNGTPTSVSGTVDYLLEFSDLVKPFETSNNTHFGTCNLSIEKEVFTEHGLFIDQVKGSDSLYCRRVKEKGVELFHQPKAVIWHRNRTQWRKIFKNQFELGYGAAINREKYRLKGKVFIDNPVLIPLLPFVRYAAIAWRLLRYSPVDLLKFIILTPVIWAVLFRYTAGFIKGRRVALGLD